MKKFFRKIHIYLSLFFLPMALLYAISGIAYLGGIKADSNAEIQKFLVNESFSQERAVDIIKQAINHYHLLPPKNWEIHGEKGGGVSVGGIDYSLIAQAKGEQTLIIVRDRSLLGDLIMLHKGKGAWFFNLLCFGFGGALMVFYITGLVMSWTSKDKGKKLVCMGLGTLIALIFGYLSVM